MKICKGCNLEKELIEYEKGRNYCKLCRKKSNTCIHNKSKSCCKECKGGSICDHNKIRHNCKECFGNGICKHNIIKSGCRECGGSRFCNHGKRKQTCLKCNTSASICKHNRRKFYCKECNGTGICEHNTRINFCKICKGSQICEHGKQKARCKSCKGSQVCEHNKELKICYICSPNSKAFCINKKCSILAHNKRYRGYCSRCFFFTFPNEKITRNYRSKEREVVNFIKTNYTSSEIIFDNCINGGCSSKRPDILFKYNDYVIIVEVDENQHRYNDKIYEIERVNILMSDINDKKMVLIRFNPDSYKIKDKMVPSCWKMNKESGILSIINKKQWNIRLNKLKEEIDTYINMDIIDPFYVVKLYYDEN